jgi:hypothetical protein
MRYAPDDIDKHELYMYVGNMPAARQAHIRDMIERMNDIINEHPADGQIALGMLAMELTGLSITEIKPIGKGH